MVTSKTLQGAVKALRLLTDVGQPQEQRDWLRLAVHGMRLQAASGQPVTRQQLAAAIHASPDEIGTLLQPPAVELDAQGHLIGLGLSLSPTPHQLHLGKQRFYTWCALDALAIPAILGREGTVVSHCPATGKAIHVQVSPERLLDLEPSSTVVSAVIPEDEASARAAACDPRAALCHHGHFFASRGAAARWPSLHPGAVILPAEEAAELGRELARQFQALAQEPDEYHQYSI